MNRRETVATVRYRSLHGSDRPLLSIGSNSAMNSQMASGELQCVQLFTVVFLAFTIVTIIGVIIWISIASVASNPDDWVPPLPPPLMEFEHTNYAERPLDRICEPSTTSANVFGNPRNISNLLFHQDRTEQVVDPRGLSAMIYLWGQFIDHDCVESRENSSATARVVIDVELDDPYFYHPVENMTMQRVLLDGETQTSLNFATPHVDASTIYGYDMPRLNSILRSHIDGLLVTTKHPVVGDLLPIDNATGQFVSGESRVNEHVGLTAIHTLWIREHNRLARELKQEWHPNWTDDELFWKARQIVIGLIQHITWEEWIPAMIGHRLPDTPSWDPLIVNNGLQLDMEFTAALFRMGHSMVPETFNNNVSLRDLFMRPMIIQEYGIEPYLLAHTHAPMQKVDAKVIDSLRNILFRMRGHDLVTFNIQRGRNLHLPSYREFLTCIERENNGDAIEGDHDLYVGALLEPLSDSGESSLPPTIEHILRHQFHKLRAGDPNHYVWNRESIGRHYHDEIQRTTLRDVMERNGVLFDANAPSNVFFVHE